MIVMVPDSAMADSAMMDSAAAPAAAPMAEEAPAAPAEDTVEVTGARQQIKLRIIEGGVLFMSFVVLCLIFGLALAIERIIYLNMATTNTKSLMDQVEAALKSGGVDAAAAVCADTRGPVASIFKQGLERSVDIVLVVALPQRVEKLCSGGVYESTRLAHQMYEPGVCALRRSMTTRSNNDRGHRARA